MKHKRKALNNALEPKYIFVLRPIKLKIGQRQSLRVYGHLEAEIPAAPYVTASVELQNVSALRPQRKACQAGILDQTLSYTTMGLAHSQNASRKQSHVSPIGMRNSLQYIVTASIRQY